MITNFDDEVTRMVMEFAKRCREQGMTETETKHHDPPTRSFAARWQACSGAAP